VLISLFSYIFQDRTDIVKGTEDLFFRYVKTYNGDAPPAFVSKIMNDLTIFSEY
jgi:hypothetical protein